MSHWSLAYLGRPWSETCDCYYWFRRIQKEVFGRDLEDLRRTGDRLLFAARAMSDEAVRRFGWRRTDAPAEGDAVFLAQRIRPHHIGIATLMRGKLYIVHAPDGGCVMLSDAPSLRINFWKISSYWTPEYEDTDHMEPAYPGR